jgi:DNA replication protein DnaC
MAKLQSLPIPFKELRVSVMANAWQEMAHKAVNEQWQPEEYLAELCEIRAHQRHGSRQKGLLKASQLPVGKQLSQYAFSEVTGFSA